MPHSNLSETSAGGRGFRHPASPAAMASSASRYPSEKGYPVRLHHSGGGQKATPRGVPYHHDNSEQQRTAETQLLAGDWSTGEQTADASQTSVYLPGDKVIFTKSVHSPGVPVIYRAVEERAANPDRLNLDRRRLTVCPILEGEDQLRLLNYQHNMIETIEHVTTLKRLIFLDLYDNRITRISGLDTLKSLRVLMLGKNRIQKIENLNNLNKLDVLDLHGNEICRVENLQHLSELRVLNLAGNRIGWVDHVVGMNTLTELNLRRNHISSVVDVENLPSLQRLFLSFNRIASFEDIACLADSLSITEVSLDGNPCAQDPQYRAQVLGHLGRLRQLDMKKVSDEEKRLASAFSRKEEEKRRELGRHNALKEQRQTAIQNARRQWEVSQGGIMLRTSRMVRAAMPDLYASHAGSYAPPHTDSHAPPHTDSCAPPHADTHADTASARDTREAQLTQQSKRSSSARSLRSEASTVTSGSAFSSMTARVTPRPSSIASTTPPAHGDGSFPPTKDYLADLDGTTLSLYGAGSLEAFDRNWGVQATGTVTTISFRFVDFDEIVRQLHKIRARFPNVQTLIFQSTNISQLKQLSALSTLRRLDHLVVSPEGNPLTAFSLWRAYVIFRLSHFSLKTINHEEVSTSDIVNAEKFFGMLGHLAMSHLPQSRLIALLTEAKKRQLLASEEKATKKIPGTDLKYVDRSVEPVTKAALIYTAPLRQTGLTRRHLAVRQYVGRLAGDAITMEQRQRTLQEAWPQILTGLVKHTIANTLEMTSLTKRLAELDAS